MLKELSNANFMNFRVFLEMAAAGDVTKLPMNFEKDDKEYLYQFPMEYWPEAMKKRFDLFFKALEDLEDSRKKAGIDDLKQRIKEATITDNWDLVKEWKPRITTGIFRDLTPVPPEKIEKMRQGNFGLKESQRKAIASLNAIRKAYEHFKSLETGLPNDENEEVRMTFDYVNPDVTLRQQLKKGKFGKRSKVTFVAKPSLDRLYHRLEKDYGTLHEKYQDILGKTAKYGFDLTDPSVVKKTTKSGDEPKEPKLRTAGMIFPNLTIIKDRMQNWLTGVENRIFLPEDENVDDLEWKPTKFFDSAFIKELVEEETKKLKRLPNWEIKTGETQTDWEMRLKKEAEKRIKALADQGKLKTGATIPGHPEYASGRKFEIEEKKKTISAKDKQIFLPFSSREFEIKKVDPTTGKVTIEKIQQPVLGSSFYYARRDDKANKRFSNILKNIYSLVLEMFGFEKNKPVDDLEKQNLLKEINQVTERYGILSGFDMQKFLSEINSLEKEYEKFKTEKSLDEILRKNDSSIEALEQQINTIKQQSSEENLQKRAVGYRKDLVYVSPDEFKKSEHLAPGSLHLTHGLVQRKFLDTASNEFWDRLQKVLPGYMEGTPVKGDPTAGRGYDGPGYLIITKTDEGYKAKTFTKAQFDTKNIEDYAALIPGQFSILSGMTKCFNSKTSEFCKGIRNRFERNDVVDKNLLYDWYEKILNHFLLNLADERKAKKENRIKTAEALTSNLFQQEGIPRRLRAFLVTPEEENERRRMLSQQVSPKITAAKIQAISPEKKWETWVDSLESKVVVNVLELSENSPDEILKNIDNFGNKWKKTNPNNIDENLIDNLFDELNNIVNNFRRQQGERPINTESIIADIDSFNAKIFTRDGLKEIDPDTKEPRWKRLFSTPVVPAKKPAVSKPVAPKLAATPSAPKIKFPEKPKNAQTKLSDDFDKFTRNEINWVDFIQNNIDLMISMDSNVLKTFVLIKKPQLESELNKKILVDVYNSINLLKSIDFAKSSSEQIKTLIEKAYDSLELKTPVSLKEKIIDKVNEELKKIFSLATPKPRLLEIYNTLVPLKQLNNFLTRKKAELKF